jgi:outer membrane protein OmpA-like peptidoglycan-associated protein
MKDDNVVHCHLATVLGILTHMRPIHVLLGGVLCATVPASAQVTVDLHALDALPGARPPHTEAPRHRTPAKPTTHPQAAAKTNPSLHEQDVSRTPPATTAPTTASTAAPSSAAPAVTTPPAPPVPVAPPPNVALAPIAPPPPPAQAAPPPPPISDTAASAASQNNGGLRVTFGAGQADLSPASADAIRDMVKTARAGDATSFNVVAYAAGTPEDPSTARRLSLSRALAVRSALIANGVGSAHIYVRALGAPDGDQTPDRVDVAVLGGNAPATSPASAQAPPPAAAKSQSP